MATVSEKSCIILDARVLGVSSPENGSVGCEVGGFIPGTVTGTSALAIPFDVDEEGRVAVLEMVWLGGVVS